MVFFFKHKTAYEMRISDWSSDVCSSDLYVGEKHILVMVPDGRLRWSARRVRPETLMLLRAAPRGQTCARSRERLDAPLLGWPVAGIVRKRRTTMRASRLPRTKVHERDLASRHALSVHGSPTLQERK